LSVPARGGALASLRHRDYRLFYSALLASGMGSQLQQTAILWQVYELTNSPLHLGLIGLAEGVPVFVFSLIGGVIADRLDRRKLIMVTQACNGLLGLLLAALTFYDLVEVGHIYAIVFVTQALSALSRPARQAVIPGLVPREHLLNGLALSTSANRLSRLVGPALGGVCTAWVGLAATYLLDALMHLITLAPLVAARLGETPTRGRQSPIGSLLEGLSFVRRRSTILVLLSTDVFPMLFGGYRILLPIFAIDMGVGAEGLGLLLSSVAAGALLGSAIVMSMGDPPYKGLVVIGGVLGYCLFLVLLALSPWFILSLLATLMLGLLDSVQAVTRNTIIQLWTPNDLRGRVSSFQTMLTFGFPSIGRAQMGFVATVLPPPVALVAGAAVCASLILGTVAARPELRRADL
jgi:MFS family permease